jgi:hypothetical protein
LKLFGKKEPKRYRAVLRAAGDTTPVDPQIAEMMRKAGIDPATFTLAPYEQGESDGDEALRSVGDPGNHLQHTFVFPSLNSAFSAIERLVDERVTARISKQEQRWVVVFDTSDDPAVPDQAEHQRFADVAREHGGEDRGFSRAVVWKKEQKIVERRT